MIEAGPDAAFLMLIMAVLAVWAMSGGYDEEMQEEMEE